MLVLFNSNERLNRKFQKADATLTSINPQRTYEHNNLEAKKLLFQFVVCYILYFRYYLHLSVAIGVNFGPATIVSFKHSGIA